MATAIKFKSKWKQGKILFVPGAVYGFEDEDAPAFFIATGFAEATGDAPDVVFSKEEIDIDPNTRWAQGTPTEIATPGQKVLG